MFITSIGAFVVTITVAKYWGNYRWSDLFMSAPYNKGLILPIVLLFSGLHFLVSELDNITQYFIPAPELYREIIERLLNSESRVATFITLVIIAPITEEIFFRGIILRGLLRFHSIPVALISSSLLFGFVHLNPWMLLPTAILGIAFGLVLLRTGSIWLCVICHSLNNGIAFFMSVLNIEIQGYTKFNDLQHPGFHPLWLDAMALTLVAIGFALIKTMLKNDKFIQRYPEATPQRSEETLHTPPAEPPTTEPPIIPKENNIGSENITSEKQPIIENTDENTQNPRL